MDGVRFITRLGYAIYTVGSQSGVDDLKAMQMIPTKDLTKKKV